LCRSEVQSELMQQVLLFMSQNKRLGMVEVCEFLRPFLNYSIMRIPFSDLSSSLFVRHLISSMASLCCLFPHEAMPVLELLMEGEVLSPLASFASVKGISLCKGLIVSTQIHAT